MLLAPPAPLRCRMATYMPTRPTASEPQKKMRVLVDFEDIRSLYREILVKAILDARPTLNVRFTSLEELADVLFDFDPHVVMCSEPNGTRPAGSGARVQIPTDNPSEDEARLAQMCLDGEQWLTEAPLLSEVFAVIDEAKERLYEGTLLRETSRCRAKRRARTPRPSAAGTKRGR
jgi:hypothetical protein